LISPPFFKGEYLSKIIFLDFTEGRGLNTGIKNEQKNSFYPEKPLRPTSSGHLPSKMRGGNFKTQTFEYKVVFSRGRN
jgi:hypothetical protein